MIVEVENERNVTTLSLGTVVVLKHLSLFHKEFASMQMKTPKKKQWPLVEARQQKEWVWLQQNSAVNQQQDGKKPTIKDKQSATLRRRISVLRACSRILLGFQVS